MNSSGSDPKQIGVSFDVKPHAYDPATQPELFDGVPARLLPEGDAKPQITRKVHFEKIDSATASGDATGAPTGRR